MSYTAQYRARSVRLVQSTPEEIRDVAVEMAKRLDGTWQPQEDDTALQERFWQLFPSDAVRHGKRAHGKICCRFGAAFLRNNRWWLES